MFKCSMKVLLSALFLNLFFSSKIVASDSYANVIGYTGIVFGSLNAVRSVVIGHSDKYRVIAHRNKCARFCLHNDVRNLANTVGLVASAFTLSGLVKGWGIYVLESLDLIPAVCFLFGICCDCTKSCCCNGDEDKAGVYDFFEGNERWEASCKNRTYDILD